VRLFGYLVLIILIISASFWLFKKKSVMMHGDMNVGITLHGGRFA